MAIHPCAPPRRRRSECGAALVLSIIVIFILTILGLALMFSTTTEFQIAGAETTVNKTFYAADSGIQYGFLQAKATKTDATGSPNSCAGAATFWCFDLPDLMPGTTAHDLAVRVSPFRLDDFKLSPGSQINVDATPLYDKLAKQKLPWKRVTIIPTDDRLVPVDSEQSNVRALAKAFLPTGARVIPVVSGAAEDYRLAGNAADARLQDLPWPPDLVWLTMDEDGGTAGLVAGPDLQQALDAPKARRAVGLMPESGSLGRVSLTRAAVLSARTILITLIGNEKRELLEGAIADGHSSKLPIGRLLAEVEQPIDIHWCA